MNLDGWMLDRKQALQTFHRHAAGADIAVVEGVMGLFDSRDGKSEDGSTSQMAKWLGAPVLLVLDCAALARSAAAMAQGFQVYICENPMWGLPEPCVPLLGSYVRCGLSFRLDLASC